MQVVSSNDDRSLHLVADNNTGQNSASDVNVSGKRALLINVRPLDGLLRSLEA